MEYQAFLKEIERLDAEPVEEQKLFYAQTLKKEQQHAKIRLLAYFHYAVSFYYEGNFQKVQEILEPFIFNYQSYPYIPEMISCFNLIGMTCHCEGEYERARCYYTRGLKIAQKYQERSRFSYEYNNLALTYIAQKNYSSALENILLAEQHLKESDNDMDAYLVNHPQEFNIGLRVENCKYQYAKLRGCTEAMLAALEQKDRYYAQIVTLSELQNIKQIEQYFRINQKLQQSIEDETRANRVKSRFLANMSHDLRTPINGIMGMLAILRKCQDDPEKINDCLEKIESSSRLLLSLVNNILKVTKSESDAVEDLPDEKSDFLPPQKPPEPSGSETLSSDDLYGKALLIVEDNELEMLVYQYVAAHPNTVPYMRIRELAGEAHVSTTTVLHFCKKVGCDGYAQFKAMLKEQTGSPRSTLIPDSLNEVQAFFEQANTPEYQDLLDEAAALIAKAERIFIVGIGNSGGIAAYGARYFSNIGKFALCINDPFYPATISDNTSIVAILLSVSSTTPEVHRLGRSFKAQGADIIAVTSSTDSPLAELADLILPHYISHPRTVGDRYDTTTQLPTVYLLESLARRVANRLSE